MIIKKAGKTAVKAAARPAVKPGAKALQKKPIDLKSQAKLAVKLAAKAIPPGPKQTVAASVAPSSAPAAAAPRSPAPPARPAGSGPVARPAPSAPAPKTKRANGAVKVGVVGCAGRMGQMLLKMLISAPGIVVVGGTERKGSIALGQDIGALAGSDPLGISVGDDPSLLFDASDVVVDFTNPTATVSHAQMAARTGCALVIGTTGFDTDQLNSLYRAAQRAPIVLAANMSLGINLLQQVVEEVARILDPDWDIEIIEMHHRQKIDAPSGTALMLGRAAADGRGIALDKHSVKSRDGHTGVRKVGDIGFAALRGGTVVGEHSVIFSGAAERVELAHKADDRMIFARGALHAARWARTQKPGLYSMMDVLGLKDF